LLPPKAARPHRPTPPTNIKRNIVMTIDIKTVAGEAINILDVFEKFAPYLSSMLATTPVAVG
jgi:hypothetical protein